MMRHCPLCGLNFRYTTELFAHARDDHPRIEVAEREEHITRYSNSGHPVAQRYHVPTWAL